MMFCEYGGSCCPHLALARWVSPFADIYVCPECATVLMARGWGRLLPIVPWPETWTQEVETPASAA